MNKSDLRIKFKKKIGTLNRDDRQKQSEILSRKVTSYLRFQRGVWTLFVPMGDEPNLLSLVDLCPHLQWIFPKVESRDEMKFYHQHDQGVSVPPSNIKGCVVPGLAYDQKGTRLGRGGGYYDRFLKNFKGFKLGVIFNEGLTSEVLPRENHDQLMNIVISPKQWIEVESEVGNGV